MSIENELKEIILKKYKTMHTFADSTGINYQTLMSIFNRGIQKANVSNIIKICQELGISTDELANNKIVYVDKQEKTADANELLTNIKQIIRSHHTLSFNGEPMTSQEIDLFIDGLDFPIEMVKKQRAKKEN